MCWSLEEKNILNASLLLHFCCLEINILIKSLIDRAKDLRIQTVEVVKASETRNNLTAGDDERGAT